MKFVHSKFFSNSTYVSSAHDRKKPLKCKMCHYTSSLEHHLKNHVDSIHYGQKPFQWKICDKRFFSISLILLKRPIAFGH